MAFQLQQDGLQKFLGDTGTIGNSLRPGQPAFLRQKRERLDGVLSFLRKHAICMILSGRKTTHLSSFLIPTSLFHRLE